MIIVSGEFKIKVELRDEAIDALVQMAEASQVEGGCIAYNFYADLQKQDTFFIYEVWASQDALTAHAETPHMAKLRAALPNLLAEKLSLTRYHAEPA